MKMTITTRILRLLTRRTTYYMILSTGKSDDSDPAVRQPETSNLKDVSEKCVNISIPSDSAFDNIAPGSSPADSSHSVQSMELPKVHEGSWIPTIKYAHTCRESESKLEKIE